MRGLRGRLRILASIAILVAIAVAVFNPQAAWNAIQLPLFAVFSTTRMVFAYLLSLVFAITYGATAATNKRAAVIMLPILDVLQSVPILGFFPAALVFFVVTFQGSPVGIELAVIFLIFTSMAWNMAFGVYESLTTIPVDLEAAAASFGLRGMLRFRLFPLAPAVPAVAKDLPDRHSAGRHQVPSGIRPPGPHVLGPSSGPPGHSLRGSRDVRCDLGAGRGRRSPRAGPVIPESSTGRGSGTPSGGRFILHSTWAGLRHRPRLDDSNGRVDRTKPARIAIHHPGARGRRVPAGHGPPAGHRRLCAHRHRESGARGGALGAPDRPVPHAMLPPVQPDRRRSWHPGRPRGGGPVVRPPREGILATRPPAGDGSVAPDGEHHGLGRGMERADRFRVHPVPPPAASRARPGLPPRPVLVPD